MPIRPPEYDEIASKLEPKLVNLPPIIIAISGSMNAGKTTLARFLAWYFNISLIETDFHLIPNEGFNYDSQGIEKMILHRIGLNKPVIVEGFKIKQILSELDISPHIIIQVQNESNESIGTNKQEIRTDSSFADVSFYKVIVSHI